MYTMNKPCVIVRSFMENSIGLKRIKDIYSATVVARCIHNDCIAPCGVLSAVDQRWTQTARLATVLRPLLDALTGK